MKRVLFFLLFPLLLAASRPPIPECPRSADTTCGDGFDNNGNGVVDETAPSNAFSAVTGGLAANGQAGLKVGGWSTATDAASVSGTLATLPAGQSMTRSQMSFCNNAFTNGTYYLGLIARSPGGSSSLLYWDTSPLTPTPSYSLGSALFGGGSSATLAPTWSGQFNSQADALTKTNGVAKRSVVLNGPACIYLTASSAVDIDCVSLLTDPLASPVCPGGGGGGTPNYVAFKLSGSPPTSCADSQFGNANVLNFTGSTNTGFTAPSCKILWQDTTTDRWFACCTVFDSNMISTTTANDDNNMPSIDDDLQVIWRQGTGTGALDATSFQLFLNLQASGGRNDANYPSGNRDLTANLNVTKVVTLGSNTLDGVANDGAAATIFFASDLGWNATPNETFNGDFAWASRNPPSSALAFSTGNNFADATGWKTIQLSNTTVPGTADTTAPTYPGTPNCTVLSTGANQFTTRCSVTEATSPPVTARLRWCTGAGCTANCGGTIGQSVTCGGVASPYSCDLASATTLLANTVYQYRVDTQDARGNGWTASNCAAATAEQSVTTATTTGLFVNASTGSDNNDGSSGTPFATIQKCADVVPSGGTCNVANGIYTIVSSPTFQGGCAPPRGGLTNYCGLFIGARAAGTASKRTVFKSTNLYGAKIQVDNYVAAVYLGTGASYIDFDGFEITQASGKHATSGIDNYGAHNRITHNYIHDLDGAANCGNGAGGKGIGVGSDETSTDNLVDGNRIDNIGNGCVGVAPGIHGIYLGKGTATIVNNIVSRIEHHGIHSYHNPGVSLIANNTIFNVGVNVGGSGILLSADAGVNGKVQGWTIVNNIVKTPYAGAAIREYGNNATGVNTFQNNLMDGTGYSLQTSTASGTITQNPLFVNYQSNGTGDYHLQSTSPAKNAGVSVPSNTRDFELSTRPQGQCDIGAYEQP